MGEKYSESPDEKREKQRERDFNKIERMKQNLMKLEKSAIDEVDEATQSFRGDIHAMGFGIKPVNDDEDDDDSDENSSKK